MTGGYQSSVRIYCFLLYEIVTVHFGPCEEDGSKSVEVRGLQRPASYVQENLRHWGREVPIKRETRPLR